MANYYCDKNDVLSLLIGVDLSSEIIDKIENFFIPSMEREIDRICHQTFRLTNITLYLNGTGTPNLFLPYRPIQEITNCILRVIPQIQWYQFKRWRHINVIDVDGRTIAREGGPTPKDINYIPPYQPNQYDWEISIEKADLFVDCVRGILTIPPRILYMEMQAIPFWNYTFLSGDRNIEIMCKYGYAEDNFPEDLKFACAMLVAIEILKLRSISQWDGATSISIGDYSKSASGGMPFSGIIEDWQKKTNNILKKYQRLYV